MVFFALREKTWPNTALPPCKATAAMLARSSFVVLSMVQIAFLMMDGNAGISGKPRSANICAMLSSVGTGLPLVA